MIPATIESVKRPIAPENSSYNLAAAEGHEAKRIKLESDDSRVKVEQVETKAVSMSYGDLTAVKNEPAADDLVQ